MPFMTPSPSDPSPRIIFLHLSTICISMPNSTPNAFTLFDLSGNLSTDNEFRDSEARPAYYCQTVKNNPLSTKIIRLTDWQIQPPVPQREPWTAWLYFTSDDAMQGYIKFGTLEPTPMEDHLRRNSDTSLSRWFIGLDGGSYRWRPASRSLHCYDRSDRLLAVYEYGVDEAAFARLDIKRGAERMVTEIVATLLLNRHLIRRTA